MQEWMNQNGGMMAVVAAVVVCLNIFLSAISVILDRLEKIIPGDEDKKINVYIKSFLSVLAKVIDWVGMNKEHK